MIDDVLQLFRQIQRTILTICGYIYILYCMWVLIYIYIYICMCVCIHTHTYIHIDIDLTIHALSCLLSWNPVDHLISMGLTKKKLGSAPNMKGHLGPTQLGCR